MKRSANTDTDPTLTAAVPAPRRRAGTKVQAPAADQPPRPKSPRKKTAPRPAPAANDGDAPAKPPRQRAPRKPRPLVAPADMAPRPLSGPAPADTPAVAPAVAPGTSPVATWLRRRIARPARWWHLLNRVPAPILTVLVLLFIAGGVVVAHLAHWSLRKPAVLLTPFSGSLTKTPTQTWAAYGTLFQRHATARVPAELLAALAQMESSGDPVAATYWRWNENAPDFFGIFRPASTSVGLYQMTDPAYDEARRYCVRDHKVVAVAGGGCGETPPDLRVLPSHAIELTAAWLDRGVVRALNGRAATPAQSADIAALTHLCGGQVARAFAGRGFHLPPDQKCGDHSPAAYLTQVRGLQQTFRRLAAR